MAQLGVFIVGECGGALWFEVIICLNLRPWILNLYGAASSGFVFGPPNFASGASARYQI
jgi:hypothetical protein